MKILLKILHFYYLTITDLPRARLTRIDFHNIGWGLQKHHNHAFSFLTLVKKLEEKILENFALLAWLLLLAPPMRPRLSKVKIFYNYVGKTNKAT